MAKNHNCEIISPALINVTQGTPNQIILEGDFPRDLAQKALNDSWHEICNTIRQYIEKKDKLSKYKDKFHWQRSWNEVKNHTWEFFWAQSQESIKDVREKMNEVKRERDWIGINWQGESSTLSGFDAVAWYGMADRSHPENNPISEQTQLIKEFYEDLSNALPLTVVDREEQLSIPELIKRLITLSEIAELLNDLQPSEYPNIEYPPTFVDLNRKEKSLYTGWFQGDGDSIGKLLAKQSEHTQEEIALHTFSVAMMNWGRDFKNFLPPLDKKSKDGRIIYAGGDDFLGILYRNWSEDKPKDKLTAKECLDWFFGFNAIWEKHQQKITVSIGFVWAAPNVPQRDVLQHCRETEKLAKNNGRDRLAIRILFNSGNHLDWHCPWWFLKDLLESYRDREGKQNWTHFYNDVAVLESRHAFNKDNYEVALSLLDIYFQDKRKTILDNLWNKENPKKTGILGDQTQIKPGNEHKLLNEWIINLAKVGFHLYD
jgi:CRISPR-associated protein Cmr2